MKWWLYKVAGLTTVFLLTGHDLGLQHTTPIGYRVYTAILYAIVFASLTGRNRI